jgi:hypothetical protein
MPASMATIEQSEKVNGETGSTLHRRCSCVSMGIFIPGRQQNTLKVSTVEFSGLGKKLR